MNIDLGSLLKCIDAKGTILKENVVYEVKWYNDRDNRVWLSNQKGKKGYSVERFKLLDNIDKFLMMRPVIKCTNKRRWRRS